MADRVLRIVDLKSKAIIGRVEFRLGSSEQLDELGLYQLATHQGLRKPKEVLYG